MPFFFILLVLISACSSIKPQTEQSRWEAHAANTEIIRDDFSAGEFSPKAEDYPNYMSMNRENFRGIHAIRLLKQAKGLSLDQLIEIAYDPFVPALEVIIPGLIAAYDQSPSIAVGMSSGSLGALASFGSRSYNGSKRLYGTSGNSFCSVKITNITDDKHRTSF